MERKDTQTSAGDNDGLDFSRRYDLFLENEQPSSLSNGMECNRFQ